MLKLRCKFLVLVLFFSLNIAANKRLNSHILKEKRELILKTMKLVADWQIANFKPGVGHDRGLEAWTNATLYLGMYDWASIANDNNYFEWLYQCGEQSQWQVATQYMYHADAICVGQFYLKMYEKYHEEKIIKSAKERADWIINNPPTVNEHYRKWTWSDALFMAPPFYAQLSKQSNDSKYILFMNAEYEASFQLLFDSTECLFYRDKSYFAKRESNGQKVFWGRGNAWVLAGLVNILKSLPKTSEFRPFYLDLYLEMSHRIVSLQNEDGFWHASLLDPTSFPAPESSATALITYALAYGVNEGLLDYNVFAPKLRKSWLALMSVVDCNGKIGWVQPIGADPKKVTAEMTDVYGVGAFLMAGAEIYKINH
jgi:unsaturated rhamnogalacturonyl hydrolase